MLNISKKAENGNLVVSLEGRLDTITAPELERELRGALNGVSSLALDLEKLAYISSAGLRVLLTAQKIMNRQGEMKVLHVGNHVMEVFELTGFSDILDIE